MDFGYSKKHEHSIRSGKRFINFRINLQFIRVRLCSLFYILLYMLIFVQLYKLNFLIINPEYIHLCAFTKKMRKKRDQE